MTPTIGTKISIKNKIIWVFWDDSRLYITQIGKGDIEDLPCKIESVGICIEDKRTCITGNLRGHVTLAGDEVDGEYRRVVMIPEVNILSISILNENDKTTN